MPFERLKERAKAAITRPIRCIGDFVKTTRQQLVDLKELEAKVDEDQAVSSFVWNSKIFVVKHVPKGELKPLYGSAIRSDKINYAFVRDDLPDDVQRFVRKHELFHLIDESEKGGWAGRELRANLIPGLQNPRGLWEATKASFKDKERRALYMKKIRTAISDALTDGESFRVQGF